MMGSKLKPCFCVLLGKSVVLLLNKYSNNMIFENLKNFQIFDPRDSCLFGIWQSYSPLLTLKFLFIKNRLNWMYFWSTTAIKKLDFHCHCLGLCPYSLQLISLILIILVSYFSISSSMLLLYVSLNTNMLISLFCLQLLNGFQLYTKERRIILGGI